MSYTTTAYCSQAQVQELLPVAFTISTTSKPNASQVESFRKSCAANINSALAVGGVATVPIDSTTPVFLDDITRLNAIGAAAQVLMAAFPASQGPGSSSLGRDYWKEFNDRLAGFRKGDGIPADVGRDSAGEAASYFTDGMAIGVDTALDAWGDRIDANPAFKFEEPF